MLSTKVKDQLFVESKNDSQRGIHGKEMVLNWAINGVKLGRKKRYRIWVGEKEILSQDDETVMFSRSEGT